MKIDYIRGPKSTLTAGTVRYDREVLQRLDGFEANLIEYTSLKSLAGRGIRTLWPGFGGQRAAPASSRDGGAGAEAGGKLYGSLSKEPFTGLVDMYVRYPYIVKARVEEKHIKHIATEQFAYILQLLRLRKTVVTCHGVSQWVPQEDVPPHVFQGEARLPWKLSQMGMVKADRIIAVSEFCKSILVKYLKYPAERITVAHAAVDTEIYRPRPKDEAIRAKYNIPGGQKLIIYVGGEYHRKNLLILVKAFGQLKKVYRDVKLVKVGGPGWPNVRNEMVRLIHQLGLEQDVIFVGHVEGDLPKLYNLADLFVMPTLWEEFASPPLEAMASGCPMVTSNIPPLLESVGDAGITVDPQDVDGLAEAMYRVLTNDALRQHMIEKGLERVKQFNWEKTAARIMQVYQELDREYSR